jgi:hypothetical protein
MAIDLPGDFDHPSWTAAATTVVGYGVIILLMTILLFAVPTLVFRAFGA